MRFAPLICAVILAFAAGAFAAGDKCRVLAMSSGGDKIAYETGFLDGLIKKLPASEVTWDVVTGISAGSIGASIISTYKAGTEASMMPDLLDFVDTISADQVYTKWPGGFTEGLLKQSGLFDSSPLLDTLNARIFSRPLHPSRSLLVGAIDMTGGNMTIWTEADTPQLPKAVLASSSFPGVFPSVTVKRPDGVTHPHNDGCIWQNVIIVQAIERCIAKGFSQADIIVDLMLVDRIDPSVEDMAGKTTISVFLRSNRLGTWKRNVRVIDEAMSAFPDVHFRYIAQPSGKLPGTGIDFNHDIMAMMVAMGRKDAAAAVALHGTQGNAREFIAEARRALLANPDF